MTEEQFKKRLEESEKQGSVLKLVAADQIPEIAVGFNEKEGLAILKSGRELPSNKIEYWPY